MYDNETTASKLPHGLTAISVLLQVGDMSNVEMRKITKAARNIRYGGKKFILIFTLKTNFQRLSYVHMSQRLFLYLGQTAQIRSFSLLKLLPETRGYITYEGSMTEPGCQETVTWIIMNRPIYITPQQVFIEGIKLLEIKIMSITLVVYY